MFQSNHFTPAPNHPHEIPKTSSQKTKSRTNCILTTILQQVPGDLLTQDGLNITAEKHISFANIIELALESEYLISDGEDTISTYSERFRMEDWLAIYKKVMQSTENFTSVAVNSRGKILGVGTYQCIHNFQAKECAKSFVISAIRFYATHIVLFNNQIKGNTKNILLNDLILDQIVATGKIIGLNVVGGKIFVMGSERRRDRQLKTIKSTFFPENGIYKEIDKPASDLC